MPPEKKQKLFYKLTREDGTDCFSGKIKFEVGKTTKAPNWDSEPYCGGGIHFGDARTSLMNTSDPRRAFLIEPVGEIIELQPGKFKAREIKVIKEINLPELLTRLSNDKDLDVRCAVAVNPKTPIAVITEFTKDKSSLIRFWVVGNPNISIHVLNELAKNKSASVRYKVVTNPKTPIVILKELAKDVHSIVAYEAKHKLRERKAKRGRQNGHRR